MITFHNVTVSLFTSSAREAYDDLCELLKAYDQTHGAGAVDWHTDTYSIDDGEPRDTTELWPP